MINKLCRLNCWAKKVEKVPYIRIVILGTMCLFGWFGWNLHYIVGKNPKKCPLLKAQFDKKLFFWVCFPATHKVWNCRSSWTHNSYVFHYKIYIPTKLEGKKVGKVSFYPGLTWGKILLFWVIGVKFALH